MSAPRAQGFRKARAGHPGFARNGRWSDPRRWLAAGIGLYVAIGLTGIAIALVSQDVRNLVMLLEQSQREEDELLAEQSRLLLERSTLTSYQNVDRVAENQLRMQFPEVVEKIERAGTTSAVVGPRQ
jgi:cell division protein FtsL